jgi:PAS domain S-box-containing protein
MAEQVGDSQSRLEEQVAVRTAALEAREAEFRTLATTAPDAIVTADEEGRITYFNPGAERTFGRASSAVIGQPLTILMPERFREAHRQGFSRYVTTGNGSAGGGTLELVGRRHDGSEFPVELSLASWRHEGRMTFTGIIRDITDRKGREKAVRRYAAELEAANQELEAFSYSVSHDLRAPLRAIHGFSQALAEDYRERLDEQGMRLLDRVRAAAERMGMLIDDLLELSRATRAEMRRETVDLTELARRIAAELAASEPQRQVDVRVADGLLATADAPLLRLVLGNLIGNAWKFTGKLEHAVIEVGLAEATSEFFVRDNGAGFDMAYVDKLFHPFQRLHPDSEFKGTGVGLALVQRIVHRHGGRTRAEGDVGVGASFYFTLPAEAQQERRVET